MTQPSERMRIRIGKVPFEVSSPDDAVARILDAADSASPISIRLSNAYCVALADKDDEYADLLNNDGLNFPDGTPVVWFMRINSGKSTAKRVRGPSLFTNTLVATSRGQYGHFFLGTTPSTLDALIANVSSTHPDLRISGSHSPPFAPLDDEYYENCAREVLKTDAKIVWVALGTPRQDFLAEQIAKRINRPCIAVGAAFDFYAGTSKEAPTWIQNSGFEWLYRLGTEPRRLWKRYLIGNFQFLWSAIRRR